jgi:hypothetical protein
MVNPKEDITESYIDDLVSSLGQEKHLIESCEIYETNPFGWKAKVQSKSKSLYFIDVELYTYNSAKHLFFSIDPQKINGAFDKDLYEIKFHIKNLVRKDWEECIWLNDEQSNAFANELYSHIHRIENGLRQFINMIMIRNFGVKWWEKYTSKKVQDKYKARFSSYKRVANSYANVSDHLLSIDTDDLLEIMTHKIKKFSPDNNHLVINLLESLVKLETLVRLLPNIRQCLIS